MFRVPAISRRGTQRRLLRNCLSLSTSKYAACQSLAIRGIRSSCVVRNASAVEPPKISNYADVEEVRETSAPVGAPPTAEN
jgi:hypothetical protein